MKPKSHWTQTPEGKKKLREMNRIRWAKFYKEKKNGTGSTHHPLQEPQEIITQEEAALQNHVAYAFGRTEAWLEQYASAAGLFGPAFTNRVAELLHRKANGPVLGPQHNLSGMRRAPAQRTSGSPKVEVASSSRTDRVSRPQKKELKCFYCHKSFTTPIWHLKHELACKKRTDSPEDQTHHQEVTADGVKVA